MAKSSWLVIIAAAEVALSGAAPEISRNIAAKQISARDAQQTELTRIATSLEKLSQRQSVDVGCSRAREDRRSELCAQWKAADAAAGSTWWTMLTFFAGALGLLIGGLTLLFAAKAAHWARKAAEHAESGVNQSRRSADIADRTAADTARAVQAAVDANQSTREANEIAKKNLSTNRAWLKISGVSSIFYNIPPATTGIDILEDLIVSVQIDLVNVGDIPASDIRVFSYKWISRETSGIHEQIITSSLHKLIQISKAALEKGAKRRPLFRGDSANVAMAGGEKIDAGFPAFAAADAEQFCIWHCSVVIYSNGIGSTGAYATVRRSHDYKIDEFVKAVPIQAAVNFDFSWLDVVE